jgi:hypothetical protein
MIWSPCYGNESRTFQSVPKLFKIKTKHFGDFLKFKNETRTKRVILLPDRNVSIHPGFKANNRELLGTISKTCYPIWNVFVCSKLLRNQNRMFVFLKIYIKTKPKHFKLCQCFLKTKQNFLFSKKNLETNQNKSY